MAWFLHSRGTGVKGRFSLFFLHFLLAHILSIRYGLAMFLRKEFEKRMEKKREEIASLEKQLSEAKSYLLALQDSMKLVCRVGDNDNAEAALRPGTDLDKAREFLRKSGKAMHVSKIIEGTGKELSKANRVSLSGSLGNYVRKGLIFTRPAPNTFGLVEFEENDGTADVDAPADPPDGFGEDENDGDDEFGEVASKPAMVKPVPVRPVPAALPAKPVVAPVEEDHVPF
jgi:hypothetical protein